MLPRALLSAVAVGSMIALSLAPAVAADDSDQVLSIDHYIAHTSTVPALAGQTAQLYARERVQAGAALRSPTGSTPVVLFVHGAGTPSEVAFDNSYADYSWMAFLARAGFDVFSLDLTGYGPSTRPEPMLDPCNLPADVQERLRPGEPCPPSYTRQLTTATAEWDEIDTAVQYIRGLRGVDKINMIAWSLGGPRVGGYATRHPDLVEKLVLLAPVFSRNEANDPPAEVPAAGSPMTVQSEQDFEELWDRQTACADQVDPAIRGVIWSEMMASDPLGATWGSGVRRAPTRTAWGWTADVAAEVRQPTLLVSGEADVQVAPSAVRDLHATLGSSDKVFVDLACSSHNAAWETRHQILFDASLEWLTRGTVHGERSGSLRLGD
jgi:pimeloyl-ACP methyl ester carboxylesterase